MSNITIIFSLIYFFPTFLSHTPVSLSFPYATASLFNNIGLSSKHLPNFSKKLLSNKLVPN